MLEKIFSYVLIFFISMLPVIELRGAIPFAQGMISKGIDINMFASYIICIVGNMVPVPFIYLFARKFLEWGQNKKLIGRMCRFFLVKGAAAGEKLQSKAGRSVFVALFIFVGIPLPGTGAWTGTLAASLINMKFKDTVIAVMCGVLLAGLIMMAISFGIFEGIVAAFQH